MTDLSKFLNMMTEIVEFCRHKWFVWGFEFSLLEIWFYCALFELIMAFVWQIFGQIPHALNSRGYKGGINNGKSGSHKSSSRKYE